MMEPKIDPPSSNGYAPKHFSCRPGDRHPLVAPTLDALNATAADLHRPTGP